MCKTKKETKRKVQFKTGNLFLFLGIIVIAITMMFMNPAFASGNVIVSILGGMIDIISMIFTAVGILLGIYSIGMLILAFKGEDADSKLRAATVLIVSIILIGFPQLVEALDLISYLDVNSIK